MCFQRDNLVPFGSEKPSKFNDLDHFPPSDIEKVFVTGITLYIRNWGSHVIIGGNFEGVTILIIFFVVFINSPNFRCHAMPLKKPWLSVDIFWL